MQTDLTNFKEKMSSVNFNFHKAFVPMTMDLSKEIPEDCWEDLHIINDMQGSSKRGEEIKTVKVINWKKYYGKFKK